MLFHSGLVFLRVSYAHKSSHYILRLSQIIYHIYLPSACRYLLLPFKTFADMKEGAAFYTNSHQLI